MIRIHAIIPVLLCAAMVYAIDEFEHPPIQYSKSIPKDPISKLQARLDAGGAKLDYSDEQGYLPAVLKALDIPVESQTLVFSKTSLQLRHITPKTPRAIYFNDDIYVGYVHSGDVLEFSAVDPQLGAVFYIMDQQQKSKPQFVRQVDRCLICHASSRTSGVPGHLVRSLFVDPSGQPMLSGGSHSVDHTTPIEQRWGGWYVTGRHGSQSHMGNLVIRTRDTPRDVDNSQGHNVMHLKDRLDVGMYLSPHSDIVALMILEHQAMVHNRLAKANFNTRQALDYELTINKALEKPAGERLESTIRRIQSAGEDLIDGLLMVGEAKITAPISGTSGYAEKFSQSGMRDKSGRSLRDLDLTKRLFTYPCSYLIYSKAFEDLPVEMKAYVWEKLWKILNGADKSKKYAHLSESDRLAIINILCDTMPGLPPYWKKL